MREEKFHKINLENVTDEDLELINQFMNKSREVLEHLIKTPLGHVLRINYIDVDNKYALIEAKVSSS